MRKNKSLTPFIRAQWSAPENIIALTSIRSGGVSIEPYKDFNLALHVGDNEKSVVENRQKLIDHCRGLTSIQWLSQVHGTHVITAKVAGQTNVEKVPSADACYTQESSLACAVMTADCLPVVFCDVKGSEIAVAHAGWKGLVSGIIESTLAKFKAPAEDILVWFGPAISQENFEVGLEVREAFLDRASSNTLDETRQAFTLNLQRNRHYFANLVQLARIRLESNGIEKIFGGEMCCFNESEKFFSYRRNKQTGRMATIIYMLPSI